MRILILMLLLAALPGASAEVYTGKELLGACRAPSDAAERQACIGWADWGSMSPYFCVPRDVDRDRLVAVIAGWLEAHPGLLHMPGGGLVHAALLESFPCAE